MNQLESYENSDFCPSCGNFVEQLDDITGFCYECAGINKFSCIACGEYFAKDSPHRKLCPKCREERWLALHADEIEMFLSAGATITFAKREVYYLNRPKCIVCGQPIKGGRSIARFCTRTFACRRWKRRYKRLRTKYSTAGVMDPAKMAISQISAEIFAEKHSGMNL